MSAAPPDDDDALKEGLRKDGKQFANGNTREDGSYRVGRNRPDERTQFRKNDGRKRGRRAKGTKNVLTEWREELAAKITVTEGGKTKRITKRRAVIKSQIDRAMKKSDRAAEITLRYAELSEKRDPGVQADDLAIIAAWLEAMQQDGGTSDAPAADTLDDA